MREFNSVSYSVDDGVALLKMCTQNGLNSLTPEFLKEVQAAIAQANEDNSVRCLVITGHDNVFSAGGDMNNVFLPKMRGESPYEDDDKFTGGLGLFDTDWVAMFRKSKPIIAAFNGYAVGGGVTCFLAADIIVASEEADFRFMFTRLGLVPEICSSKYLPARVGFGRASEILLTARTVKAEEALSIGLVDYLYSSDTMLDEAMKLAKSVAANPVSLMIKTKELLDDNYLESDLEKVWARETDALRYCFNNDEHKEAVNAFLEKRKPVF